MRFDNRAVPMALAAVLIDTIGFGIVMPVFPRLITGIGHVGLEQATRIAGYMLVVYAGTQFVAGPILGNLSDRFGRRPVLAASMLAFGFDYALMAWAPSLGWLFLGRAIAGAAGAVYGPAGSVIADVTPAERRAGAFARIGAAFGIGFVIGPALGGLIAHWGLRAPFVAAAGLALVNAGAMYALMPETLAQEHRRPFRLRDAHIVGAFRPLFHAGNAAPLLLVAFVWQLAHMVLPATWSFWGAIRFGWSPETIGWSLAVVGLAMAVVQFWVTGRVIAAAGERRALIAGLAVAASSFVGYACVTQSWQVWPILALSALQGFVFPATQGLMSRLVDASRQGALQGGLGSLGSVSAIVSPLAMTQVLAMGVDRGIPGAAFLLAAALVLVALATVLWTIRDPAPISPGGGARA